MRGAKGSLIAFIQFFQVFSYKTLQTAVFLKNSLTNNENIGFWGGSNRVFVVFLHSHHKIITSNQYFFFLIYGKTLFQRLVRGNTLLVFPGFDDACCRHFRISLEQESASFRQ